MQPTGMPVTTASPSPIPVFTWIADNIQVTSHANYSRSQTDFNINIHSNSLMYEDQVGNFRMNLRYLNKYGQSYVGRSDCIKATSMYLPVQKAISKLTLYYEDTNGVIQYDPTGPTKSVDSLYRLRVKRYFNPHSNTNNYDTTFHFEFIEKVRLNETLTISLSTEECAPYRTIGQWSDANRWDRGSVPVSSGDVVIPANAGVIKLSANVTVNSLTVLGGQIVGYDTYCPFGWSVEPGYNSG